MCGLRDKRTFMSVAPQASRFRCCVDDQMDDLVTLIVNARVAAMQIVDTKAIVRLLQNMQGRRRRCVVYLHDFLLYAWTC